MYYTINQIYHYPSIIYTLYATTDTSEQVVEFVRDKPDIKVITMPPERNSPSFTAQLTAFGKLIYYHTFNDTVAIEAHRASGIHGFYTDYVYPTVNLPPTHISPWAVSDVHRAMEIGLVPSQLRINFVQPITRLEFCILAVTLYEMMTGTEIDQRVVFADTNDIYVEKAAGIGVVHGVGSGSFAADGLLTRQQAATMLARLAEALGGLLEHQQAEFDDYGNIAPWALEAVGQMQAAGIMGGIGGGKFSPDGDYTKEQSITTMLRLYDIISLQSYIS